jgi:hypothetical protein
MPMSLLCSITFTMPLLLGMTCAAAAVVKKKAPPPQQDYCGEIDLDQGWSCDKREDFWFRDQGSRLLPYSWFLYLEQADSSTRFRDNAHMDDLRFIPAEKSARNPDALPVGFAKDPAGCTGDDCWVGLTCAACHTAKIDFGGHELIVDGAPGLLDYNTFMRQLIQALEATIKDASKFDRFAAGVLAQPSQRDALYQQVRWRTGELRQRYEMNDPVNPAGFARVDAFGNILNQVLVHDLDLGENIRRSSAPVSYPCLWDTPQHDKVQWNGTGASRSLAILRNIGEALGVFGTVDIAPRPLRLPSYRSSIGPNLDNLNKLEDSIRSLYSPVWPKSITAIDQAKYDRGAAIYKEECERCHNKIDRKDPARLVTASMDPIDDAGTDPAMALNFAGRMGATGRLQGTPKLSIVPSFGVTASGAEILSNVILGTALGGVFEKQIEKLNGKITKNTMEKAPGFTSGDVPKYKARPLNGVWATAPYLHNGSVPNLWELLKEEKDRIQTFHVGDRTFDPKNVGFTDSGAFVFDTTLPGNYNTGHRWGTELSPAQKWDLIEYLKGL